MNCARSSDFLAGTIGVSDLAVPTRSGWLSGAGTTGICCRGEEMSGEKPGIVPKRTIPSAPMCAIIEKWQL